jgi:hypothetical protein
MQMKLGDLFTIASKSYLELFLHLSNIFPKSKPLALISGEAIVGAQALAAEGLEERMPGSI